MGTWLLGQQVLRAGITDISGITNIADIADVADISMDIADISTDIADIGTDIADIAMGIADVVDSADIADRMLRTLRWKRVDAYKVSRGCPVIKAKYSIHNDNIYNINKTRFQIGIIRLIKVITGFKRYIKPTLTQLGNCEWVTVI